MKNYLKTWNKKVKSSDFKWQIVHSNAINGLNLQEQRRRQNNITDLAKRKRLHRKRLEARGTGPTKL